MKRRPTQVVAGHGFAATAERATRQYLATEEGQHVCRPFPVALPAPARPAP